MGDQALFKIVMLLILHETIILAGDPKSKSCMSSAHELNPGAPRVFCIENGFSVQVPDLYRLIQAVDLYRNSVFLTNDLRDSRGKLVGTRHTTFIFGVSRQDDYFI